MNRNDRLKAAAGISPELSSAEARQIMQDAIPRDCGIRAVASDVNEQDAVVYWTAVIFDPLLPEGDDAIGTAQFSEHWPEVDIDWTPGGAA